MTYKYNIPIDDDFNIWYDSKDPEFTEINIRSRVPTRWMDFNLVKQSGILKPINMYAEYLCPPPELVSIENNVVRLRQKTHADIYLLNKKDGSSKFYNVDRPWIRQYYQTIDVLDGDLSCFAETYKFYTPWILDESVMVHVSQSPESPFKVYPMNLEFVKNENVDSSQPIFIEPKFVKFKFKKDGDHMEDEELGVIRRGANMFDMVFGANDIIVEKVRNFYDNYKVSPIQR